MAAIPASQCQAHKMVSNMRHHQHHSSPGVSASEGQLTPNGSPRRPTSSETSRGTWFSLDNFKKYIPSVNILHTWTNGNPEKSQSQRQFQPPPQEGTMVSSISTVTQDNKNNNQ